MEENTTILPEKDLTQDACAQELAHMKQQYAYLQADFENYRKRVERERITWMTQAQADVLVQLIDIIDDFERALGDIQHPVFELMYKAAKKLLAKYDVQEIQEVTVFDPRLHEAVSQVARVEEATSGNIVQVYQKGYTHKGSILRPARVSVYE